MGYKFVILSVACFAFLLKPAHSTEIAYVRAEEPDPVQEISSLVPKLVAAKANAVMKAAADVASVFATGMGLGVRTFGKASSDINGVISDGLLAMGDSILRAGDTATGARDARVLVRRPVVQELVEEVKVRRPAQVEEVKLRRPDLVEEVKLRRPTVIEEVVKPARRVLVRNEPPSLWNLFGNAVQAKMNVARMLIRGPARSPTFYEVIKEPRLFPGPLEEDFEFEFKKK